ncbi:class I SAM-dependent methyltransferase [Helicobacter didelphidarum]|uniref:class I SAM-dependent methyltransferase n=1 Tax=Helicobacter didelphidarum TaxID=2040648 RepID=UPI0015F17CEA|nr:class I SAM-dependent methyltransferase [Helicobacter didelphidarum]
MVENLAPHLKDKWHLYTGGFIVNHIQKIGKDIDFCIIDTVHSAPGEAMDFLMVLPYLSKNATIILHDLGYHCSLQTKQANICLLLFLALNGLKIIPDPYANYKSMFQNIGSCILHDYDERKLEEYFRLLSFPWVYIPSNPDLSVFREFVRQHYGIKFALYFDEILILQKQWQNKKNEYAHLFKYPKIAQSINTLISCRMFPRDMIRFIKKKLHKR